jgi:hypothetical protein
VAGEWVLTHPEGYPLVAVCGYRCPGQGAANCFAGVMLTTFGTTPDDNLRWTASAFWDRHSCPEGLMLDLYAWDERKVVAVVQKRLGFYVQYQDPREGEFGVWRQLYPRPREE